MIVAAISIIASILTVRVPVSVVPAHAAAPRCTGILRAASDIESSIVSIPLIGGAGGSAVLELVPARWLIELDSENCWAPTLTVDVEPEKTLNVARMRVWPRATMSGKLRVRSGETLPRQLKAGIRLAGQETSSSQVCPVVDHKWKCSGPMASVDLRLEAEGFAPLYFWSIGGEGDFTKLPDSLLERGGSVTGWVLHPDREPAADVEVQVVADALGRVASIPFAVTEIASRTDHRGFFQVRGLPLSSYFLRARSPNGGVSTPQKIDIAENREYVVRELTVEPPATVEVMIEPQHAPDGSHWLVQLDRFAVSDGRFQPGSPKAASEDGRAVLERVERGAYRLRVLDGRGSVLARLEVEVDRDLVPLLVHVGHIPIEGRVRLGTDPVAATLKFDSAKGRVEMLSNEEGDFEGWLPEEGKWRVQVTPVGALQRVRTHVDVRVPSNATKAKVNLDLPGGRIEGVVENERGDPVPDAEILVLRGTAMAANAASDAKGTFSIRGLQEGAVALVAKKGQHESAETPYTISASGGTKAILILGPSERIVGTVLRINGRPVIGALIRYLANNVLRSTVSGPSGEFELELPSGATFADVIVVARDVPIKIAHLDLAWSGRDIIVADAPGLLRVKLATLDPSGPVVRRGLSQIPISFLLMPREGFGSPPEADGSALRLALEPGTYEICYRHRTGCSARTLVPGVEVSVDDAIREGEQ